MKNFILKITLFFAALCCCTMMANATEGALPGLFSVSGTTRVQFSQGNLQYQASTSTFRFATSQFDYIGESNSNISTSYFGWIDLFGWGTGYNPTLSSSANTDYSTFTDWGVNAISNGGNKANQWRTLTKKEWAYLFTGRTNAQALFGLGSVNGINGVIILPDDWTLPSGLVFYASSSKGLSWQFGDYFYDLTSGNHFSDNAYSSSEWSRMEAAGAVFLPAAGDRNGMAVYNVGQIGEYWSAATYYDEEHAYGLSFSSRALSPKAGFSRHYGQSVRLVTVEKCYVVWVDAYDKNAGTATGGGYVPEGTEHTVSATPKDGYHFLRWSNGVTKNPYTFVVTQDTVLWAIFEKEVVINYYDIRVASADETMGWVEGGALQLEEGQKVNIKAYPRSGYQFLYWMDSHEQVVSGKAIYEVTVTNNETYTAYFRVQPPADAYNLWVRGTQVTASNSNDILGDGVWNYNHDTRVLTAMDNATYDITNDGFIEDYVTSGPLTVVLDYNIDVTCTTTDNTLRNAIYSQKGITFTGSAFHGLNLNVKNMQAGNMSGDLTITGHIDFTVFLTNTTDWGKEHIDLAFYTSKNFIVDGANVDIGTSESTYKVSNKTNDNLQVTNAEIISGAMNARALYISDNSPKYEVNYLTPSLASLCAVGGFNSYFEGTKVTLRAYPQTGYKFVQWSDGSEDNPRYMVMPAQNVYLDPIVEVDESIVPKGAIINVNATEGQGSIIGFTSGWYAEGTELTITAEPAEGYEFVQWSDGNTANPYYLTVEDGKNITIIAMFCEKGQGIENIQVEGDQPQKIMMDGILYIVRDGKIYNAQGTNVR